LDYPITGGGFETFTRELFGRYAPDSNDVHGPHSIYFGVLAEHGFVGLAIYMFVLYSCWRRCRRLARTATLYNDQIVFNYAKMFELSLIGFTTSGMFLGRAYFDYWFTILACTLILKRLALAAWREEASMELISESSEVVYD